MLKGTGFFSCLSKIKLPHFAYLRLLALVLIMMFSVFTVDSYAWWSFSSSSTQSTHDRIGKKAFELVQNKLVSSLLRDNANKNNNPDNACNTANNLGYLNYTYTIKCDSDAHGGDSSRNGGDFDNYYRNFYLFLNPSTVGNSTAEALKYLGLSIHLIQDMSVPAHAFNIPHAPSWDSLNSTLLLDNFEHLAGGLIDTYELSFILESDIPSRDSIDINKNFYTAVRSNTLEKVKNSEFATYWLKGSGQSWCGDNDPTCSSGKGDDGPKGHYDAERGDQYPSLLSDCGPTCIAFLEYQLKQAVINTASFLLAVDKVLTDSSTNASTSKLPDTGQTKCYQSVSPYAEITCAGTGQDGAYNINSMSYTDNGNGTITDNVTGLMWQKGENSEADSWYKASGTYDAIHNPSSQNICGSLTLGGQSGWRLPTKKELLSIVDYGIHSPGPAINTTYFPNTHVRQYWSSTTIAGYTDYARDVFFLYGSVGIPYHHKSGVGIYVRCVRGRQSSPSFTDNGNGTVTDNGTALMWQQGEPGSKAWADALTYCEGLSLGGQSDWRLPNIKELESITDDTKYNPAIDTTYFPNANADFYWSSTAGANGSGGAWVVDFNDGSIYGGIGMSGDGNYVRCVRGGQSGSSTQNNCAASVSSSLVVNIPILTFSDSNYWADLQYNSSSSNLTFAGANKLADISPYSSCTASTISSGGTLHIPVLMISGVSYWADLQWNGSAFVISGGGQN